MVSAKNDILSTFPKVVLVGRVNSGKSTLFNRLAGSQKAVTSKIPGTTRDWVSQIIELKNKSFLLIDTAGFLEKRESELEEKIKNFWEKIIKNADLFILVVDSRSGPTPQDKSILDYLRQFSKPIILAITKVDNTKLIQEKIRLFSSLSVDDQICVSGLLNKNIEKIKEKIASYLKNSKEHIILPNFKIALIGRPNVGKSTLLNSLIEQERSVVDEKSGTTRDEIEAFLKQGIVLIDTPGLKRKSKIQNILEFFSSRRSIYSLKTADLVILIIDASEGPVHQEVKIASLCQKNDKKILVVINKIDLVTKEKIKEMENLVKEKFHFLGDFPLISVSGLTKENLDYLRHYLEQYLKVV